jgi:large subunit ribosomal protein L25
MKSVSISGSLRGNVGKKDAKKWRVEGKVPCVLYGGKEQIHFVTEETSFGPILFSPNSYIVKVNIDGVEHDTVLQDVQYHPISDKILHVDFLQLTPGKPVIISIPVKLEGVSAGVLKGGKIDKKLRKLKVKAMQENLPDELVVHIDDLDIGGVIKVSEMSLKNVEFLDSPSSVIVMVKSTRVAVEPTAEGTVAPAVAPAAK